MVQCNLPTLLKYEHKNIVSMEIMYININMMQRHYLGRRGTPSLQEIQILITRKTWKSFKQLWTLWLPSLLEHPLFLLLSDSLRGLPPLVSRWLLDLVRWLLLLQRCFFKISNWFAWLTEIFLPLLGCTHWLSLGIYCHFQTLTMTDVLQRTNDAMLVDPQRTRIQELQFSRTTDTSWAEQKISSSSPYLVLWVFSMCYPFSHLIHLLKDHRLWDIFFIYISMLKFLVVVNMCLSHKSLWKEDFIKRCFWITCSNQAESFSKY